MKVYSFCFWIISSYMPTLISLWKAMCNWHGAAPALLLMCICQCWGWKQAARVQDGGVDIDSPHLVFSPVVRCSLLVKWQLGAERRIRSNIGSSLQLKHHGKNCLALSVMLLCAITDLTILENAGTENLSSVFQFLLLVLSFHKYSRSGNEDWLPRDQSCLTGHGCESRFGPESRRGLVCHLVFWQCKILTKSGTTKVVGQWRNQCFLQYLSCWASQMRGKGWLSKRNEFVFPIFAFTAS